MPRRWINFPPKTTCGDSVMMLASGSSMAPDVVLWSEGAWRCELHVSKIPGEGRLLVFYRDTVVTAESVHLGTATHTRAEILRLRVLRGDFLPAN